LHEVGENGVMAAFSKSNIFRKTPPMRSKDLPRTPVMIVIAREPDKFGLLQTGIMRFHTLRTRRDLVSRVETEGIVSSPHESVLGHDRTGTFILHTT
jgi:hypothetical protein